MVLPASVHLTQKKTTMKKRSASRDGFLNFRLLLGFVLSSLGVALALLAFSVNSSSSVSAAGAKQTPGVVSGTSYHNDVSPALRDQPAWPVQAKQEREAAANPLILNNHNDMPDTVEIGRAS